MVTTIKRSDVLRVKVSPDMNERLDRLSQMLGLPPSTLAALAVGHWVANQERGLGVVEQMAEVIGNQLGDGMAEEIKNQMGLFSKENKGS